MNNEIIQEEWRNIIDYPDYLVSNLGNIKSINTGLTKSDNKSNKKDRFLKFDITSKDRKGNNGYYSIKLCNTGKCKSFKVHILVARHFVCNSNPELNIKVNHKDGNSFNNNSNNLEWVTQRENAHHSKNRKLPLCISLHVTGKYLVRIYFNNKTHCIGYFSDLKEAVIERNNFIKENNIQSKYL